MYKLETHLHVFGTSPCAVADVKEIAEVYAEQGYNGIVYTCHYNSYMREYYFPDDKDFKNYNRLFVKKYESLKSECSKKGIDVFFGMELMPDFCSYFNPTREKAEFLVYGPTPDFVLNGGERLFAMGHKEIFELCRERGWILSQAHPFRSCITYREPKYLNAAEVENGGLDQDSRNDLALKFAEENRLIFTSGSDYHRGIPTRGLLFDEKIQSERDLADRLKLRKHVVIRPE